MSLRQALDDVAQAFPVTSPEEASQIIIASIEATLPDAIANVRFSKTPSPLYLRKREFELQRRGKASRESVRISLAEHDAYVREIASIQKILDGTAVTQTSPLRIELNLASDVFEGPSLARSMHRRPQFPDAENRVSQRLPDIQKDFISERKPITGIDYETNPLETGQLQTQTVPEATAKELRFNVGPSLQERLPTSKVVEEFARTVEAATRRFALGYKLNWDFDLDVQTDIEEQEWTRTVLRIHPTGMGFEEIQMIWERIDKSVRTALESLGASMGGHDAEAITGLNRDFYIELNLA